jgi:hypothetical protein
LTFLGFQSIRSEEGTAIMNDKKALFTVTYSQYFYLKLFPTIKYNDKTFHCGPWYKSKVNKFRSRECYESTQQSSVKFSGTAHLAKLKLEPLEGSIEKVNKAIFGRKK